MLLNSPAAAPAQNKLLALLPPADRKRVLERCEPVSHDVEEILAEEGEPIRNAWFPTTGVISQIQPSESGWIEVALVGYEGMVGVGLVMGVPKSIVIATTQAPGELLRMPARAFNAEVERSSTLRRLAGAYAYVQMKQMALAAACNRYHLVEQRLARWLLMASDRVRSRRFRMTHDVMAQMLGVRRTGVTSAASALQGRNLLRYHRGTIEILDRPGLENVSCECYRLQLEAYDLIMK
ncbi:MAG TPA: Crp/Fnr family transcriptional regulator [Usitatibacter sp.]|jgi:CRP-like cAMP-binding protein|nr:Crp/Fnr family transcriptional regulator [Usitatibacter sp.]